MTLLKLNVEMTLETEDSPRLVFIDEECGNLIVVHDGGDLTRSINQKRIQTFYNSL